MPRCQAAEERRSADAERHTWVARADALAQALDEGSRPRREPSASPGVEGVVGTLLDLVEIDDGFEAAFEAAAGEALAAVVVDDVEAGRRALEMLHAGDLSGAVLALGATRTPPALPLGSGEPLRWHVRSSPRRCRGLLDALLGAVVVVDGGWAAAVDLALAHPDSLIVTRDGDRFGVTGWRVGGPGAGATGAALVEARERRRAARPPAAAAELPMVARARRSSRRRRTELEAQPRARRARQPPERADRRAGARRGRAARRRHRGRVAAVAPRRAERAVATSRRASPSSRCCCPRSRPRRPACSRRARR